MLDIEMMEMILKLQYSLDRLKMVNPSGWFGIYTNKSAMNIYHKLWLYRICERCK